MCEKKSREEEKCFCENGGSSKEDTQSLSLRKDADQDKLREIYEKEIRIARTRDKEETKSEQPSGQILEKKIDPEEKTEKAMTLENEKTDDNSMAPHEKNEWKELDEVFRAAFRG